MQGLSTLAVLIISRCIVFLYFTVRQIWPMYCRMFSSISAFYPLEASIIPHLRENAKCLKESDIIPFSLLPQRTLGYMWLHVKVTSFSMKIIIHG